MVVLYIFHSPKLILFFLLMLMTVHFFIVMKQVIMVLELSMHNTLALQLLRTHCSMTVNVPTIRYAQKELVLTSFQSQSLHQSSCAHLFHVLVVMMLGAVEYGFLVHKHHMLWIPVVVSNVKDLQMIIVKEAEFYFSKTQTLSHAQIVCSLTVVLQ